MLEDVARSEDDMRKSARRRAMDRRITGRDSLLRYLFDTTLNIDGIWSGYTGPGMKTILPHKATAKVDSRLVPNQTPDEALALIRAHLDAKGFRDIEIRKLQRLSAGADVGGGAARARGDRRVQQVRRRAERRAAPGGQRAVLRVHGTG